MQESVDRTSFGHDKEAGMLAAYKVQNLLRRHGICKENPIARPVRQTRSHGDKPRFQVVVVDDQCVFGTQPGPEEVAYVLNVMREAQTRRY